MRDSFLSRLFKHLPFQNILKYICIWVKYTWGFWTTNHFKKSLQIDKCDTWIHQTTILCQKGHSVRVDRSNGWKNQIWSKSSENTLTLTLKKTGQSESIFGRFWSNLVFPFILDVHHSCSPTLFFCSYPILGWSHSHGCYKICVPVCLSFLCYVHTSVYCNKKSVI